VTAEWQNGTACKNGAPSIEGAPFFIGGGLSLYCESSMSTLVF
jgi:hypothetical protein